MSWVLYCLGAVVVWAVVNILDKFVMSKEAKDAYLAAAVSGITSFIVLGIISMVKGPISLPVDMIILALAAGSCQVIGVWFYYQSIQDEDVSKMMPLYSIAPIFVALLSWAFLGEVFSKLIYLGILLIIAGSFILSYKKGNHKITLNPLLFIVILSTLIFAFRALFIKMATLQAELWPVFFWIGLGTLIPSIVFLVIHRIRRNQLKAIEHFFIVDIISQGGYILNLLAISAGPIALVSALTQTKPLLVFIFATFVTLFKPKFIKEDLTRTLVIRKIIAIVLIIAGSLLII